VIDAEPTLRQFEIPESAEDLLQDPTTEQWPLWFEANFVDQPGAPAVRIYRASELDNDSLSAHYLGIGRKGWPGHHGAIGWAKWSRSTKRWEVVSGFFKTVCSAIVTEAAGIPAGPARGTARIWWKAPTGVPFTGLADSGADVEVFNDLTERIPVDSKIVVSYDRQENLWTVIHVQWPVMIDVVVGGAYEQVGKLIFDNTPAGLLHFHMTNPNPGEVRLDIHSTGDNFVHDPRTLTSITVSNGLITNHAH